MCACRTSAWRGRRVRVRRCHACPRMCAPSGGGSLEATMLSRLHSCCCCWCCWWGEGGTFDRTGPSSRRVCSTARAWGDHRHHHHHHGYYNDAYGACVRDQLCSLYLLGPMSTTAHGGDSSGDESSGGDGGGGVLVVLRLLDVTTTAFWWRCCCCWLVVWVVSFCSSGRLWQWHDCPQHWCCVADYDYDDVDDDDDDGGWRCGMLIALDASIFALQVCCCLVDLIININRIGYLWGKWEDK